MSNTKKEVKKQESKHKKVMEEIKKEPNKDNSLAPIIEETWGINPWKLLYRYFYVPTRIGKQVEAMYIHGLGCLVKTLTQNETNITEALEFIPAARIRENTDPETKEVLSRELYFKESR